MRRGNWFWDELLGTGIGWSWADCGSRGPEAGGRGRRRRAQVFESGEVKYVILRLLKEKPRHGYEVIKALEERVGGWYTPSAGTVYPTLQLLEDQGYVRVVEEDGKKVYHITAEGEAFLVEHRDVIDDIFERVEEAVKNVGRGSLGELNQAFGRLAALAYRNAWRWGPDDPRTGRILEVIRKAVAEIEADLNREGSSAPA